MTKPLVECDVDLRGLPFMPLDTVRLMDSDLFALSTGEEFKAALSLWCKAWQQVPAASLPNDERVLAHLSGAGSRWKKLKQAAMRGFILCDDDRWYHPVVAEKAIEAWKHRIAQRDRATKRWQCGGNAAAYPTAHATAEPTAYPAAMQGTVKGQLSKEEPKTKAARKRATPVLETRIPHDFAISDRVAAWADGKGYGDLAPYLEAFIGRNKANGKKYIDWDQAFMNAIREDWYGIRERRTGNNGPPGKERRSERGLSVMDAVTGQANGRRTITGTAERVDSPTVPALPRDLRKPT